MRFSAYELLLCAGPGVLLYLALGGRGDALRALAVGWPLGYAVELAFEATAVAGVRDALPAVPALVAGVSAMRLWRQGMRPRWPGPIRDRGPALALALVVVAALVSAGAASFPETPLPGTVDRVSWFQDLVFHLGLSAEALYHWPITDPKVAGESLPYYTWVNPHMAAITQVTGVPLPTVLFRLYLVPMIVLVAIQAHVAARDLLRSARAGVVGGAAAARR